MNSGTKQVTVSTATGFVLCMFPPTAASFIKVYTDVLLSTRNLLPATAQERLLPWAFEIRGTAQPEHMPSLATARRQTADSASHCTKRHSDTLGRDQNVLNTTLQHTSKLHAQPLASTAKFWPLETLIGARLWPTARASNRSEILASIPKLRLQIAAWKHLCSTQWWIDFCLFCDSANCFPSDLTFWILPCEWKTFYTGRASILLGETVLNAPLVTAEN